MALVKTIKRDSLTYEVAAYIPKGDKGKAKSLSSTEGYSIKDQSVEGGKSYKFRTCGKNNLLPQDREKRLRQNYLFPRLLETQRKVTIGGGALLHEKRYHAEGSDTIEIKMPDAINAFFKKNKVNRQLGKAGAELFKHGGFFVEFLRDKQGMIGKKSQISSFKVLDTVKVRAALQDDNGDIPVYLLCGNWAKAGKTENGENFTVKAIPNYKGEDKPQDKFILYVGNDFFFDGYYYDPVYVGIDDWLDVSNKVPEFHNANVDNGYFLRFQIEIPFDYFTNYELKEIWDSLSEDEKKKEVEAEQRREDKFIEDINKFLTGHLQTGRAIFTKYELDRETGKVFPGIKITPIEGNLYDEALLKLQESASAAIVSASGMHPAIANIQTAGKLSSGSEIMNAYNAYLQIQAPFDRQIILDGTLNFIHEINGWGDDYLWLFKDNKMVTLDKNKEGVEQTDPNPAAQ